ncbi:MAG: arginyltransferase [Nitrospirota bacterium]
MNQKINRTIPFHESYPCAYFSDGRTTSVECIIADAEQARSFHIYLAQGYRRVGNVFYRNVCERCAACRPLRVVIDRFALSKSQKRTMRRNRDIRIEVTSPSLSAEKVALYERYLNSKHAEREKNPIRNLEHLLALHYGYPRIMEMDYYDGDRLIAVGIVDEAIDALSSNYFYYDTDYLERRPGVFSAINEILFAHELGKRYYYIGFYIEETEKMSYKKFFRPNQVLENGEWKEFIE